MSGTSTTAKIVKDLTGMWWPDADSGKLRQTAQAWTTMAEAIDDLTAPANKAAQTVIGGNTGTAVDAFRTFWERYYKGGTGWLPDSAQACRQMAKALSDFADDVDKAVSKLEEEATIVGASLVAGAALAFFTAGLSEAAAGAAAASVVAAAEAVGVTVSDAVATIVGTTLTGVAFGSVESVAVDLAVAQPIRVDLFHDGGFSLTELQDAGKSGAIVGGVLGGGGATAREVGNAGGVRALLDGLDLEVPALGPSLAIAGGAAEGSGTSLSDLIASMRRTDANSSWPRSARKGPTKPKYRADIEGDEGQPVGKSTPHTIAKHVAKLDRELSSRLRADRTITGSSSYLSTSDAQFYTDETLLQQQSAIAKWLASGKGPKLPLSSTFDSVTGRSLTREAFVRGTGATSVYGVKVILIRDPTTACGYRVLTSFPTP